MSDAPLTFIDCSKEFAHGDNGEAADSNSEHNAPKLLGNVFEALSYHASMDVFAIGGKIDLEASSTPSTVDPGSIVIRCDSGDGDHGRKVSLPVADNEAADHAFQQLLGDCQPATFGKGKEEVLDEEYRKAGKMDQAKFCTSFNLAEHGIIETITQTLVQSTSVDEKYNGIKAELYKLNIYSGPSGKFKSHVDTPRSDLQMGSLVVCLPYPHQGHRVTLTFNLYWTGYGPSFMAKHLSALDLPSLHFYAALEKLINCSSFLPEGGLIGFSCTHGYPHTSPSAIDKLDYTLKGLDMAVYQTLKHLVGNASVNAALDAGDYEQYLQEYASYDLKDSDDSSGLTVASNEDIVPDKSYLSRLLFPSILHDNYDNEESGPDPASILDRGPTPEWKASAFPKKPVTWLNGTPEVFCELAVAFIAYGNEASLGAYYSTAVITAQLPAFEKRKK